VGKRARLAIVVVIGFVLFGLPVPRPPKARGNRHTNDRLDDITDTFRRRAER
jgi:hypothetical protein